MSFLIKKRNDDGYLVKIVRVDGDGNTMKRGNGAGGVTF